MSRVVAAVFNRQPGQIEWLALAAIEVPDRHAVSRLLTTMQPEQSEPHCQARGRAAGIPRLHPAQPSTARAVSSIARCSGDDLLATRWVVAWPPLAISQFRNPDQESTGGGLACRALKLWAVRDGMATVGFKCCAVCDDSCPMTRLTSGLATIRERAEGRSVDASGQGAPLMTVLWVVIAIGLAWVATYLAGGSSTAVPHAFYVPIIVAAVRFGSAGALVTSLVAGLVVGPLMPLDVAARIAQSPGNWATRLVIFVVIGQFTAYLVRHSLPSLTTELGDRRTRNEIRDAIAQGQMRVEYQPIVELASGEVVGAEALVRWDHPTRGLIGPDEFVCEAERTGCIGDITRFVLAEACTQVARWRTGVLSGCEQFKIAVNLSGADLSDDGLALFVGDVLAESGLPNDWLHLEVTETALVADVDAATNSLMALRVLGVRLALDDFGTGASSLAHLHRFPLDVVKIDRLFVTRAETHEYSAILTNGIISLTHTMGLTTVAEGIETDGQAQMLRDFGCELAQGFLFSRPLRPENFETFYTDLAAIGQHGLTRSDHDTDRPHWL